MNTTARRTRKVLLAAPLAALALALAPGAASAEVPGPGDNPIVIQPNGGDPKPMDLANPTPKPDPKPQFDGPDTLSDGEQEPTVHPKPQPKAAPAPAPAQPSDPAEAPEVTLDQGCFSDCDLPEVPTTESAPEAAPVVEVTGSGISADRLDSASPVVEDSPVAPEEAGFSLTAPLAGLAGLLGLLIALIVRKRKQA